MKKTKKKSNRNSREAAELRTLLKRIHAGKKKKKNPTRKQQARRKKARSFLKRQARKLANKLGYRRHPTARWFRQQRASQKNLIPALLSALEQGAGFAAGEKVFAHATSRKTMKKNKKKPSKKHKPRKSQKPRSRKKNPGQRITHAVAVRNRIVAVGTKSEINDAAKLLRAAGMKPRIGKRRR